MTAQQDWSNLSKREMVQRAKDLDARRQAQIQRQIDSINRLIDAQGSPKVHRYEHELMTLNEQLALQDVRLAQQERAIARVAQMIVDKRESLGVGVVRSTVEPFLDRVYQVLVTEAGIEPYHDVHGRTRESDQADNEQDPAN